MTAQVVTRFAPSPTGYLHLGNLRTALLNWLFARKHGGRFLLRFEDTDAERCEKRFVEAIVEDLRWLGLNWDGEALFQSAHAAQHERALAALAERGLAYRCFCTEQQLALDRKLARARGLPPRYAGRCRRLAADVAAGRAEREAFVWRLRVHGEEGSVIVPDLLRGEVRFARRDLDDPVVKRSDGSFTFLLPNAIDDALDGITHVLRGDDHLTNSAYQVWLLEALGYVVPTYLHHGLLLAEDGSKLSKRSGSISVRELRAQGVLPDALFQAMIRLGHPNLPDDADRKALCAHFDACSLSTAAVRWQEDEIWRWQARLLHAMPVDELAALLGGCFPEVDEDRRRAFAALVQGNLSRLADAKDYARLLDVGGEIVEMDVLREAGRAFFEQALDVWRTTPDWGGWTSALRQATGRKGRALFLPLRLALTGRTHGPEMRAVVAFLGKDGVACRLRDVLERLEQ